MSPSMSFSWKIIVVMFVLAMITCIPATASNIEHCIRLELNPPPPAPRASAIGGDLNRIVCKDAFRAVGHFVRATGKLPLSYLGALCNIFGDDEQKIEHYIKNAFKISDFNKLVDGRSCAIVRKKLHPTPPSSLPRL